MEGILGIQIHEINPMTMAIIASQDSNGKPMSYILEETTEYTSKYAPSKLVDQACKFFGSSLKGRQEGTRIICGLTHKVPVSIEPVSGMFFFPTNSPASSNCSWIAHSHIKTLNQTENGMSEIVFKSGKEIKLDVSFGSIRNQLQRTAQFRFLLETRIQFLKGSIDYQLPEEP